MLDELLNLSDKETKRRLIVHIGALTGPHSIIIKRHLPRRSNQANRWMWGVMLEAAQQYMNSQGEKYTKNIIHEYFKKQFLPLELIDPDTGEVLDVVGDDSHTKNIAEFSEYLERCTAWLAERGVEIPTLKEINAEI